MMEKPISDQILTWLSQYNFEELTAEQSIIVLKNMSEEDYRAYKLVAHETQVAANKQPLAAPSNIKKQLDGKLAGQFVKSNKSVIDLLSTGIPIWFLMLSTLGLYLIWTHTDLLKQEPVVIEKIEVASKIAPEIIYKTDTIYQEVKSEPIVITKEVIKYIEVEVPVSNVSGAINLIASQAELGLNPSVSDDLQEELLIKSKKDVLTAQGQTVAEDEALMIFLDGIND